MGKHPHPGQVSRGCNDRFGRPVASLCSQLPGFTSGSNFVDSTGGSFLGEWAFFDGVST